MKKALLVGGIVSLFIAGCCIKPAKITCGDENTTCTQTPPPPPPAQIKPIIKEKKVENNICFIQNGISKRCILRIEASGVGVVPCNGACSVAQAKAMARRAAIVSAYRNLAEKLYGIKINGRDSVKNMVLQSSTIRTYVEGIIRGATIEDENFKDGTYTVVLSIKLDPKKWNSVLSANGYI